MRISGERMLWVNWAEDQPGAVLHQLRDCVRMVRSRGLWLWRETPCESFAWKYHFICQYSESHFIASTIFVVIVNTFVSLELPLLQTPQGSKFRTKFTAHYCISL